MDVEPSRMMANVMMYIVGAKGMKRRREITS